MSAASSPDKPQLAPSTAFKRRLSVCVPLSTLKPIEIEGWHFRNGDNTGPNTGDVNAPDETRRFLFSPRWPHCEEAARLDKNGFGVLEINDMELDNLAQGEKANIVEMEFSVVLTVGPSACTVSPARSR
jgi:hypothetical protein